jgi:hypothetical protein
VPENLVEKISERINLRGFLIERESQRMKTERFLESNLFMNAMGFVRNNGLTNFGCLHIVFGEV